MAPVEPRAQTRDVPRGDVQRRAGQVQDGQARRRRDEFGYGVRGDAARVQVAQDELLEVR